MWQADGQITWQAECLNYELQIEWIMNCVRAECMDYELHDELNVWITECVGV